VTPPPRPLVVLAGPTGAGKTALAVRLAETFGGEILSADSRQIYRDFNLGTGKPSPGECARVKHHLISTASPRSVVTAAEFARLGRGVLDSLEARGLQAWVVGGTGLWIRALVDGLAPTPPADMSLRAAWAAQARELGPAALHAQLERLDPAAAGRLPIGDVKRVIRALEIIRLTGQPASAVTSRPPENGRPALWLGLTRSRADLYARAEKRVDAWLAAGWLEEVRGLQAQGLEPECPAFQALGYAHLVRHLQGALAWDRAVALIKQDTRRYIKRQLTWFSSNPRITWFDASDEARAFLALQAWLGPKLKM
jgi:tRNA dimethylallyltransferase